MSALSLHTMHWRPGNDKQIPRVTASAFTENAISQVLFGDRCYGQSVSNRWEASLNHLAAYYCQPCGVPGHARAGWGWLQVLHTEAVSAALAKNYRANAHHLAACKARWHLTLQLQSIVGRACI
jgi:hypothetical protein